MRLVFTPRKEPARNKLPLSTLGTRPVSRRVFLRTYRFNQRKRNRTNEQGVRRMKAGLPAATHFVTRELRMFATARTCRSLRDDVCTYTRLDTPTTSRCSEQRITSISRNATWEDRGAASAALACFASDSGSDLSVTYAPNALLPQQLSPRCASFPRIRF